MGKGKKKAKGKKNRDGKKSRDDAVGEGHFIAQELTPEQKERARLAAANRTEDPLKNNWTRLQNEECPICMLPLPYPQAEFNDCVTCGKIICMGCVLSTAEAHVSDGGDTKTAIEKARTCPYCRSKNASNVSKTILEALKKRVNAGHHEAMRCIGSYYFHGMMGLQQDKAEGLKWIRRAVEAGSGKAAGMIGTYYYLGNGVEKDCDKALEYYQKATELGDSTAFSLMGHIQMNKGDVEEGILNIRKAAMCGLSVARLFSTLKYGFAEGYITKDEYAFTLRENQAACNEM